MLQHPIADSPLSFWAPEVAKSIQVFCSIIMTICLRENFSDYGIWTNLKLPDSSNEFSKMIQCNRRSPKIPGDSHACEYLRLCVFNVDHLMGVQ